jgi:hypothetical protein
MWRTKAVQFLLIEEVARIPSKASSDEAESADSIHEEELTRASARATRAVVLDWVAILVLVLLRQSAGGSLELGASVETIFTLGILAVAVHSGFRLGQRQTYRTVARLCQELAERDRP